MDQHNILQEHEYEHQESTAVVDPGSKHADKILLYGGGKKGKHKAACTPYASLHN